MMLTCKAFCMVYIIIMMTTTKNTSILFSFLFPCFFLSMFLLLLIPPSACRSQRRSFLSKGSYLSVENDADVLVSPDGSFTCGFHLVGTNAFVFSVWFSNSRDKTVAWTANRDREVNGRKSRATLRTDGNLVLTDADGTQAFETKTRATGVDRLELLNSGNLVLKGVNGSILWQSFDWPTDTLLPTQPMTKDTTLVSSMAKGMVSTGKYKFYFDSDNVLKLIYGGPEISSIFWPNPFNKVWENGRTNFNSSRYGVLDDLGQFVASDFLAFKAADLGPGIRRRITMDYDGNLRLHSLDASRGTWSVTWQAIPEPCDIHGTCGMNGICTYTPEVKCTCPPGFVVNDPSDWSKGCKRTFSMKCTNKSDQVHFLPLPQTDFWGFDLNYTKGISFEDCSRICAEECSCQVFGYRMGAGECYPKTILFNGKQSSPQNVENDMYLKYPISVDFSKLSASSSPQGNVNCSGTDVAVQGYYTKSGGGMKWEYFYSFIAAFFVIEAAFIIIGWWFIAPGRIENRYEQALSSHFKRFSYRELKRATKNFKDVLGRGGSGSVYKGKLDDDRVVAIKKLEDVVQGEGDFQAELSVIDMIYHKNLVRMFGFCAERSHRLILSEFVQNGSLDRYMVDREQGAVPVLPWNSRFKIATGVAEGLAYLHHECFEWVVHCDVKPENILLDGDFEPKIADFGLAKLLNRRAGGRGSNLSRIRGTRGYIAPEWASSLPISEKVDVYSYGVVLLELVKGRRVSDWVIEGEEELEMVLRRSVAVLREKLQENNGSGGETLWIADVVDARLEGQFDQREAVTMVEIAIACLEEERNKRPTMESVLQLLLLSAGELNSDDPDAFE